MTRSAFAALLAVSLISLSVCGQEWRAQWITAGASKDTANTWLAFRTEFSATAVPQTAIAKIAVDSKYWLWVNDSLVVFEGGLKRGPNPMDTYYDEVDIAPFLKPGRNQVRLHVWFFGKHGFSHNNSGRAGLLFDCVSDGFSLVSDRSWQAAVLPAYQTAPDPQPNFRLPESSILYDARLDGSAVWAPAVEIGEAGAQPWNRLVKRPIPLWKNNGLRPYANASANHLVKGDTLMCQLPYNAQITPYLKVMAPAGRRIVIMTDNYVHYNGSDDNVRAEYITRDGVQEYENPGWLNGHWVYYLIPEGVEVLDVKYRETGYATDFAGSFRSSDAFLNGLWEKARRTLYITMRDTYMDCPDRERAQWTGDAVLEAEEAFYALDTASHALASKWLHELIGWQREDGSLFAPVPAGNWDKELPDQVLASIGYYGLWTYYLHTGDRQTIADLYPAVQRYLALWEKTDKGLVKIRQGGWLWGDWGENKDMLLIFNMWYYLALKGNALMADELGLHDEATKHRQAMNALAAAFNDRFWNGAAYRDPDYTGETDDRVQALAVVSGVAEPAKYPAIMKVLQHEEHASPYMEKYVFEAMYIMSEPDAAVERHKKRFGKMVSNDYFTTLFEGWGIGSEGFGGGTVNHAWSGGGLTVLSSRLCGIRPLTPGYRDFLIAPQPGKLEHASATVASVKGEISVSFHNASAQFTLELTVPEGTTATVQLPAAEYQRITVNGREHNGALTLRSGRWTVIGFH